MQFQTQQPYNYTILVVTITRKTTHNNIHLDSSLASVLFDNAPIVAQRRQIRRGQSVKHIGISQTFEQSKQQHEFVSQNNVFSLVSP
jgi:hypothetical protein